MTSTRAPLLLRLWMVFVAMLASPAFMAPATAQGLFETVITVNDMAITRYELEQRERFLTLLRAPGDPAEEAREGLIEDRLRLSETRRAGINLSPEQVREGMEEFASRANLTADQFIQAISQAGVDSESFRDFVTAGLAWRNFVQARFGPRAQVTEAEIDRALAQSTTSRSSVRVLLSEIIVPVGGPNDARNRALVQRLSETIRTESAFASAARRYSASGTRGRGGRLDWLPLGQVPPALRAAVLVLEPGEVSDPIPLGPGIGIFQLRALEETEGEAPDTLALEYVKLLIPGGNSDDARRQAQRLRDDYDTCDDLYKPAQSLPPEYFERLTQSAAEVPGDIALELAKLDDNEVSSSLTQQNGAFKVFLMLCGRTLELPEVAAPEGEPELGEDGEPVPAAPPADRRDQVRQQLFSQRVASYADSYLEELRADAIIVENP